MIILVIVIKTSFILEYHIDNDDYDNYDNKLWSRDVYILWKGIIYMFFR